MADSSLVAREVGNIRIVVCASPAYLAAHGTPAHPRELLQHQCISWTTLGPYKAWELRVAADESSPVAMAPIRVRLSSTTPDSAVDAACAGLGLVQATSYQVADAVREGTLMPVLRGFEAPPIPVSLVYPSKRLTPLKLRAFLDFVAPRLARRLEEVARIL